MDPIRPYASASTDALLARTMEDSGDHDPTTIQSETGKPLHFDAMRGADLHREGLRSSEAALGHGKDGVVDQLREKAIDKVAEMASRFAPALGGLGTVATSVIGLATNYKSFIEDAHREGEEQRALGASDAGVAALAESLDFEPSVRASIAQAHGGSSNAAAVMMAKLGDPAHASVRAELQLRADRGFVDAAGYAKLAAQQVAPLVRQAHDKLRQAASTADPAAAARLQKEATELSRQAVDVQNKYLAPVLTAAHADAAYGLGVQRAMLLATQAASSPHQGARRFDEAFAKANANVQNLPPRTIPIQG